MLPPEKLAPQSALDDFAADLGNPAMNLYLVDARLEGGSVGQTNLGGTEIEQARATQLERYMRGATGIESLELDTLPVDAPLIHAMSRFSEKIGPQTVIIVVVHRGDRAEIGMAVPSQAFARTRRQAKAIFDRIPVRQAVAHLH